MHQKSNLQKINILFIVLVVCALLFLKKNSLFLEPPIAEHKATVPTNRPDEFTKSFFSQWE